MKCEICRENEVEIKTRAIINAKIKDIFICRNCLKKYKIQTLKKPTYTDYLKLLIEEIQNKKKKLVCGNCGISYLDFIKEGKLGCPFCYIYFSQIFEKIFKNTVIPNYNKAIEKLIKNIDKNKPEEILKKADIYLKFDDLDMAKKHLKKLKKNGAEN
jgi:protein arginine kinase activator